jgi:uncharacterized protein
LCVLTVLGPESSLPPLLDFYVNLRMPLGGGNLQVKELAGHIHESFAQRYWRAASMKQTGQFAPARRQSLTTVWLLLALPPVLFFAIIVLASALTAASGVTDPGMIAERVSGAASWLILAVQLTMLAMLGLSARQLPGGWGDLGWSSAWMGDGRKRVATDAMIGVAVGLALAALYIAVFSPLTAALQRSLGDYVPPGRLLPSLGAAIVPFFVANVVLAPVVEETLYRGFALPRLVDRFGIPAAVLIGCVFFGLLHWSGGIWYMLLTGIVAGGAFSWLYLWRGSIVVPFAAHLALNTAEFAAVAAGFAG